MEVTKLSPSSVRIKGKLLTFVVNPTAAKEAAQGEVTLLFEKKETSLSGESVEIVGPGEYEVKSIKFSGLGKTDVVGYETRIDGMNVLVTRGSLITKGKDVFGEYQVVIIEEDLVVEQSTIATMEPSIVILYGEKSADHVKAIGKEVTPVSKYVITKDKLPQEMEIVLLS